MFISQAEIDQLIKEDLPYIDLTSSLLGIQSQISKLTFISQDNGVAAGIYIVEKIFTTLGITISRSKADGDPIYKGEEIISGTGPASVIHGGWIVAQNVLSYCCSVASYTRKMVDICQAESPKISLLLNRKQIPGTKSLAIPAIIAGGAVPHRLGLSESILVFEGHREFFPSKTALADKIMAVKHLAIGKKILMDARTTDIAAKLASAGADIIQFHGISLEDLKAITRPFRRDFPKLTILIDGYIDLSNLQEYIETGVDGIVTSAPYFAKPFPLSMKVSEVLSH